ncbi:hypothetical protein PIB30_101806, partial [Stylosanthes scabra]|nr:hypothetical protein [Stylosanthes scabra]
IERTLRHIRQVRRRIQFENNQDFKIEELAPEDDFVYSSASETNIEIPSSNSGTNTVGEVPRINAEGNRRR